MRQASLTPHKAFAGSINARNRHSAAGTDSNGASELRLMDCEQEGQDLSDSKSDGEQYEKRYRSFDRES